MESPRLEGQSFLPLEQSSSTQRFQHYTIPRRPLRPQSIIAPQHYLNSGKLQDSNLTINVPDHGSQENSQQAKTQHEFWSPKWLRRRTLLAFVALFAAFDVSLVALWRSSEAQNGFRPTLSSNHYAWTYGPTAVLVVVLGLWRQVDYHCKIMQPWQEMCRGATNAAQSVLLDYVSPLNITSFTQALRYRHIPVAVSIAGFVTLKLIILFSTGLLVLTPTTVFDMSPATITTNFDGSSFWDTMPDYYYINETRGIFSYYNVSASPVHAYLGLLDGEISDPRGTVDGKAFQSFEVATHPGLSSISLRVTAFVPNITCEVAKTTTWYSAEGRLAVKLDTATCSVGHEHQTELIMFEPTGRGCDVEGCPPFQILYDMWRVNCSEIDSFPSSTLLNSDTPYDFRYALAVANVSYPIYVNSNNVTTNITAHDLSIVICKVEYSVNEATVTHDIDENSYSVDNLIPGSHLNNLTGLMLGEIIYSSFGAAQGLLLSDFNAQYFGPHQPLFYVLLRTLNGEQAIDRFLSTETLQQSATQVFGGVATQFMQQFYLVDDDVDIIGDGIYIEERLHIRGVSLWAMVAGFALLMLFSLTVMFTTLPGAVPQDPGPIATSATILFASTGLQKLLHGTGSHRTSQLVERLRGWTFQTNTGENFNVRVAYEGALTELVSEAKAKAKHSVWIPYAARYWMVALTFGSPLAAIAALEVLYRTSNANMGLVDVFNSEDVALYLSRYISAVIMFLIATSFNSLDFAVASFAPFGLLRSGAMPARRSLYFHLLGKMPPVALFQSLRTLHLGSAFSNMAGIIASVLTVVASGLWTIHNVAVSDAPIIASVASNWDVTWPNSALYDGGAADTLDQIQHGSASLPSSIWNDLVFPDIAYVQMNGRRSSVMDSTSLNYTFDVSAIRPVLTCDMVEDDYIHIQWTYGKRPWIGGWIAVDARPPLPPGCQLGGWNGTNDYTSFSVSSFSQFPDRLTWIGHFYDIHLGSPMIYTEYDEDIHHREQPDNPAGCPSIGIIFSEIKDNATTHDDVTVLLCSQKLQQVSVKVIYDGSDTHHPSINHDIAPIPDEGSARYLTNGTNGVDTFPYRVQSHFVNNLTRIKVGDEQFDSFFNNLVYGPDGTPLRDLTGRANRDRLLEAIQRLYVKYMVLALDLHLRQRVISDGLAVAAGEQSRLTGTVQGWVARLQVNFASKLALQFMLGVMTLLGAGAFWLTDLRGTLPRNPCSISSTMGFLAGSDLCDSEKPMLPKEVEWLNPRELEKVLEGWLFSLGWWTDRQGEDVGGHDGHSHARQTLLHKEEKNCNRFGIDVGTPERLGFGETKWWTLRRRLGRKNKDTK